MYGTNRLLKKIISENWFGEPVAIRIFQGGRTTTTGVDNPYIDNPRVSGGGVLGELGCHALDTAFFITNATGFEILETKIIMDGQIDRKIEAKLHIMRGPEYRKCLLDYCVSWLDRQSNTIEVEFPTVLLTASLSPGKSVKIKKIGGKGKSAEMHLSDISAETAYQAFFMEWSEFLEGLEHKTPSILSADHVALTSSVVDQLYQNARN
jgi:predicted dehydrogenase